MNIAPAELSARTAQITPGAAHVLRALSTAQAAAAALAAQGYDVHAIHAGPRNPIIWIGRPMAGRELPGVAKVTRVRGPGRPTQRIMATYYQGCQVQWEARS